LTLCFGVPTYSQPISSRKRFRLHGNGVAHGQRPTYSATFALHGKRAKVHVTYRVGNCSADVTLTAKWKR